MHRAAAAVDKVLAEGPAAAALAEGPVAAEGPAAADRSALGGLPQSFTGGLPPNLDKFWWDEL